jgi:hypothetical protein
MCIYDVSPGSVVWIPTIEFEHVGHWSVGAHSALEITCDRFFLMTAVTWQGTDAQPKLTKNNNNNRVYY